MRVNPTDQTNLLEQDEEFYEDLLQDLGTLYDEIIMEANTVERFVG